MILRRSNIDLKHTDTLDRGAGTFPGSPFLDMSRPGSPSHFNTSSSAQRPPWCPPPQKKFTVKGVDVSYGGRALGPGSYDNLSSPWVRQPSRRSAMYASTSPRAKKHASRTLTSDIQPMSLDTLRKSLPSDGTGGGAGVRWSGSPRKTGATSHSSPPCEGQLKQTDPYLNSIASETAAPPPEPDDWRSRSEAGKTAASARAPRNYRRSHASSFDPARAQRPSPRPTTASGVGPGTYNLPKALGARKHDGPHSWGRKAISPAFVSPRNSRAARNGNDSIYEITKMIKQPFGGDWVF